MSSAHITFDTTGDKIARRVRKMRPSAVRNLFAAATRDDVISLSGGMPAVSLLPEEDIRRATLAAIESPEARAVSLQYGPTDGLAGLRAVLADMMRDLGIRVKADQVLVTTGAQQALTLIAEAFIDPDDIIITEGPTYLGALQAFSAFEPDVRAIPFDEDGMRMDLLEEELKRIGKDNPRLKFCYTIPNFQNPGGVTMTAERRRRLLELAREYNFMVVEDDPYGRLRYDGGHQVPLKAMDDSVIYLGTISKMLGPGLRTGWIAAPEAVLARINLVKQGADLCGSAFDQLVVQHYFADVAWQRTLQKFIALYKERRDAMLAALDEFFPPGGHLDASGRRHVSLDYAAGLYGYRFDACRSAGVGRNLCAGEFVLPRWQNRAQLHARELQLRDARIHHRGHPTPGEGDRGAPRTLPRVH